MRVNVEQVQWEQNKNSHMRAGVHCQENIPMYNANLIVCLKNR